MAQRGTVTKTNAFELEQWAVYDALEHCRKRLGTATALELARGIRTALKGTTAPASVTKSLRTTMRKANNDALTPDEVQKAEKLLKQLMELRNTVEAAGNPLAQNITSAIGELLIVAGIADQPLLTKTEYDRLRRLEALEHNPLTRQQYARQLLYEEAKRLWHKHTASKK